MESFLDRFFSVVDESVDDPHSQKRISKASKLRNFYNVEKSIWERMLTSSVDTVIGFARATITLKNDVEFYNLPGNFRRFLKFRHFSSDDVTLLKQLQSVPYWDTSPGVVLLDSQQGFIVQPVPSLTGDEDWILEFQKGPMRIHQSIAKDVGVQSIQFADPASSGDGELIRRDDYYVTALVHVYDADEGIGQTREVISFNASSGVATLRHPWEPKPEGAVKYEVRPLIPPDYDELYALEVALKIGQRRRMRGWRDLVQQQSVLFKSARSYFMDTTADRAPSRTLPAKLHEVDPYEGS